MFTRLPFLFDDNSVSSLKEREETGMSVGCRLTVSIFFNTRIQPCMNSRVDKRILQELMLGINYGIHYVRIFLPVVTNRRSRL